MAIFEESFMQDLKSLDAENLVDHMVADVESLVYDDLDSVSKLQKSQRYIDIMQKVEDALQVKKSAHVSDYGMVFKDDNTEYQFITVECTALLVDLDNEIAVVHNYIRDNYRAKYPELEGIVDHPIDYARVVKKIGNEMDLTLVDLEGLLPSATIMVVSVTAATTSTSGGKPLSEENLKKTVDACDRALELDLAKKKVLGLLESRMRYIAPNLSAIVKSGVAAKLLGTAGGLSALAKIPACNVQLLGAAKKKNLQDFSTATTTSQLSRVGCIEETEIIQSTPPCLRIRACRLLAAKSAIATRVDYTRIDPTGETGKRLRDEIRDKIEKWQELPIAKPPKPLPVPNEESNNKKRGGSQLMQMKEKYAMTETRKLANRMQIGVPEEHNFGHLMSEC